MGGTQSVQSPSSSPTAANANRTSRPPSTRRLSSFRPSAYRKSSHLASSRAPSTIGLSGSREAPSTDVSAPLPDVTVTERINPGEDDQNGYVGVPQSAGSTEGSTPCLSTAPGAPVYHPVAPSPASSSSSSYSLPASIDTSVPTPDLVYPQPDPTAKPLDDSPTPPRPTSSPFRPSHSRNLSLPNRASPSDRTISGTLTALLGFSGPADLTPPPAPENVAPPAPASAAAGIEDTEDDELSDLDVDDAEDDEDDEDDSGSFYGVDEDEEEAIRVEREAIALEVESIRVEREAIAQERSEIAELRSRLDTARNELAQSRVALDGMRARSRVPVGAMLVIQGLAQTRITSRTVGDEAQGSAGAGAGNEAGAGIAGSPGTVAPAAGQAVASGSATPSIPSPLSARRPNLGRRISDGSLFRRRRENEVERGASLEQQARMISGLLTVAAAATANTLLAVPEAPSPSSTPRTGLTGALQSLLDRLRPARSPQHGIEQALGQYLQNVVRDARRPPTTATSADSGAESGAPRLALPPISIPASQGGAEAGSEFQAFLQGLEGDLVGAVRAYAGSVRSDDWTAELESANATESGQEEVDSSENSDAPTIEEEIAGSPAISGDDENSSGPVSPSDEVDRVEGLDQPISTSTPTPPSTSNTNQQPVSTIPTFHSQLGQNAPPGASSSPADRYGVSGGRNGQPRHLNFFRAHLFPPIALGPTPAEGANAEASGSTTNAPAGAAADTTERSGPTMAALPSDPNAIVPCIFVGVRSVQHDPNGNDDDVFNTPGLFGGPAPPSTATPTDPAAATPPPSDSTRPPLARMTSPPLPNPTPGPRSFRERFLSRLSRRPPLAPAHPVNTYLVYVIGGNYPANHPILRIPALLTGAPLTDEDMALISELMGPAKAPTASKEDIERAGLKLVDGSLMAELGAKGEVLDNCTERCLICLGDYEEGEECRVLTCRHGYHKACVDQWLEKGSNSCPACRSEAVDTNKTGPGTTAVSGAPDEGLPTLSPPIPVLPLPTAASSTQNLAEEVD